MDPKQQLVKLLERQINSLREQRAKHMETIERSRSAIERIDGDLVEAQRELDALK